MIKNQTTSINEGEASMKLQAKVAVVTGGGSGFGEGIAKLLAENGATVAVADINPDGANRVAAEIEAEGGRLIRLPSM
jgi:3-oxoacyl-[acyl-carrier protein] reductase